MFGVDSTELIIIALAALVFIGPKELPTAMRTVGRWVGRARGHARHFTAGIENMMREAELEEMEKRWREENERIMREHPVAAPYVGAPDHLGAPAAPPATPAPVSSTPASTTPPLNTLPEPGTPEPAGEPYPPSWTPYDEPALPLPEPEHQKRELP